MPLLTCQNLTIKYEWKRVITDLSFTVNARDYLCIVGENGSGKSTLMKAILGLKALASGQIVLGEGLTSREMGYLPQQTMIQRDFPATVREVVLSGCLNRCGLRPYFTIAEKLIAEESLEKLGIPHIAKRCYSGLSGGQQQRVLLARALCAARKVLLLDEPAAGLDPEAEIEMYGLIKQFNIDGITIIMISHDIEAAVDIASHILHIGKTPFFGTTAQYLESDMGRSFPMLGGGPE